MTKPNTDTRVDVCYSATPGYPAGELRALVVSYLNRGKRREVSVRLLPKCRAADIANVLIGMGKAIKRDLKTPRRRR